MADPIEIIETVVSVSQQIYNAAQCIKGAPDEQKAIESEVDRLHVVLERLVEILGGRVRNEQPERETKALQSLCDEARKLIDLANGTLSDVKTKGHRLRKVEWPLWLMKKSNREDLTRQLQKLNAAIDTFFSYDGHRELGRFRTEVDGGLQVITQQIGAQTSTMQDIRQSIQEFHGDMSDMLQDMSRRLAQQDRREEDMYYLLVRHLMRSSERDQSYEINQHYDQVTTMKVLNINPGFQRLSSTIVARDSPCTHYSVRSDESSPPAVIQNMGSYCSTSNNQCPPSCRCRCHGPPISAIPKWLDHLVGRLFIHHDWLSAIASARTACDDRQCRRHRSNLLQIRYYCPTWFAQINAEIRTERLPVHFVIQTPRVVQKLDWLERATLDEIRQKLWSRELTVNDVEPDGESVLHTVTLRLTVDGSDAALSIVALLTEHSAPTDWEYEGLTPTEHALRPLFLFWHQYGSREVAFSTLKRRLGPHLPQDIEEAYEGLATKWHWTELHRLVCLLSSCLITSIPPELVSQVNIEDSQGFTPLFYTVLVHPEAIHALLAAGANPRIGSIILNGAVWAGAATAISMLVRAGVPTAILDANNSTALHCAAGHDIMPFVDGFAVAQQLVRHAGHLLDWNARDAAQDTPLDLASQRVHDSPADESSRRILELYQTHRIPEGAQYISSLSISDVKDGSAEDNGTGLPPTSLVRAGLSGDVDAIGDLIDRDAMVNERDHNGLTLLHHIALGRVTSAYRVALELVRHGGWGLDWDARMTDGDSALDIVRKRLKEEAVEMSLSTTEYEELEKIHDLLEARRLPPGEKYLWPCMDPDFYKPKLEPKPTPTSRMPGAWDDE